MRRSLRRIVRLPAVRFLLPFTAGCILHWRCPVPVTILLPAAVALLSAVILLWLLHARLRPEFRTWLPPLRDTAAVLLLLTAGMLHCRSALRTGQQDILNFADRREHVILTGIVAEDPRVAPDRLRFRLRCTAITGDGATSLPHLRSDVPTGTGVRPETPGRIDSAAAPDSIPVTGMLLVSYRRSAWDEDDTLRALRWGDVARLRCRLRTPLPSRNPGAFDARTWMISEGCLLFCSVSKGSDLEIVGHEDPGIAAGAITAMRRHTRRIIGMRYGPDHAALMAGLLLGDRGGIGDDVMEDFRDAGIMHILAVSGLHAGIILLIVFMPLDRLRYPLRAGLALTVLWGFAAMTGLAPPVVRAALMSTLFLGGVVLQRRSDPVNALAAAALIILLMDPLALFGLSFQLSFAAVFGILLFHERVRDFLLRPLSRRLRGGVARMPANLFALTISAQSFSLPLLAVSFGQVSPSGLLVNLAAVPMVFLAVTCGACSVAAGAAAWLSLRFAAVAGAALDVILLSADALAQLPLATLAVPQLPAVVWIGYAATLVWLGSSEGRLKHKFVMLTTAVLAAVTLGRAAPPAPDVLRIAFLDVGQGDAAVIHLPGGEAVLVDAGPASDSYDAGERVILPYLRYCGIRRLHTLVITHPDNDHRGGVHALLEAMPVGNILLGGRWPEEGAAGDLLKRMRASGAVMHDVRAGSRLQLPGNVILYGLSPVPDSLVESSNENSVVFRLDYGHTCFLFTGDADTGAEQQMVRRYSGFLRADVLKVGHHGSATSTADVFLAQVQPRFAVISAGRNNRFGHPDGTVGMRLLESGAEILRTDAAGAVLLESDGKDVRKVVWR